MYSSQCIATYLIIYPFVGYDNVFPQGLSVCGVFTLVIVLFVGKQ